MTDQSHHEDQIKKRILGSLLPVLVPMRLDDEDAMTDQEREDLKIMIFRDMISEYGVDEARRLTPSWEDLMDPETGEPKFPEEDMQHEMVLRFQATQPAKAIVLEDPDDFDRDYAAEYLRSQGIDRMKPPKISNRSIRVVGKSIALTERHLRQGAVAAGNYRWGNEMQVKHNTILRDEEDLDNAGLTTDADGMRDLEIFNDELAARGL